MSEVGVGTTNVLAQAKFPEASQLKYRVGNARLQKPLTKILQGRQQVESKDVEKIVLHPVCQVC